MLGTPIVLTRFDGTASAFVDRCPHRNAPLSAGRIAGNALQCPYHGWTFGPDGHCQHVPGLVKTEDTQTYRLTAIKAVERNGLVWLYLGEDNPSIEPLDLEGRDIAPAYSFIWKATARGELRHLLENFLDGTHTHFVHAGLVRTHGKRQRINATVKPSIDRVEVRYFNEGKQAGLISKIFEGSRSESFGRYIYPSIAEIEYRSRSGTSLAIRSYLTPTSSDGFDVYAQFVIPGGKLMGLIKRILGAPFFALALRQDLKIVELQYQTIKKFGHADFRSTELDLMSPHIDRLLKDGPEHGDAPETTIECDL